MLEGLRRATDVSRGPGANQIVSCLLIEVMTLIIFNFISTLILFNVNVKLIKYHSITPDISSDIEGKYQQYQVNITLQKNRKSFKKPKELHLSAIYNSTYGGVGS